MKKIANNKLKIYTISALALTAIASFSTPLWMHNSKTPTIQVNQQAEASNALKQPGHIWTFEQLKFKVVELNDAITAFNDNQNAQDLQLLIFNQKNKLFKEDKQPRQFQEIKILSATKHSADKFIIKFSYNNQDYQLDIVKNAGYTEEDKQSTDIPMIIGASIGIVSFVTLVLILMVIWMNKRTKR